MFKHIAYPLLTIILLGLGGLTQAQAQQFVLRASVFSAGGQQSTVGNFVLQSTIGQPGIGLMTDGNFVLDGGFWLQVAHAGAGPQALPSATDDTATTDEDTAVAINVIANDADPAGGTLTIVAVGTPEHGAVTQTNATTLSYTPEADFFGEDDFSYTVQNEQGGRAQATVTISVNPVNDAPVFTSTPVAAIGIDTEYRYVAETVDVDGDARSFTAPVLPSWLALVEQTDSSATLVGTPTAAEAGEHAITLAANDGQASTEQTFAVTVTATVPAVPMLLAPDDGAVVDPSNGVPLAWEAAASAASYRLDLATIADFSVFEARIVGIPDTTWTLNSLLDNTIYYWRVRAENSLGTSDYSATRSFSTGMNVSTEDEVGVPTTFTLHPNYPNPFNPTTTIAYDVPQASHVSVAVYDLFGRLVRTLVDSSQPAGRYTVQVEAGDLASGTYFYRMQAGAFSQTRQFILLK